MSLKKITVVFCRSCIRDNEQKNPTFSDEKKVQELYEEKLKKRWFGKIAELKMSDCLTNCRNPNSVKIEREDGEILFGWINDLEQVDQIVALAESLKNPKSVLRSTENLADKVIWSRGPEEWGS